MSDWVGHMGRPLRSLTLLKGEQELPSALGQGGQAGQATVFPGKTQLKSQSCFSST